MNTTTTNELNSYIIDKLNDLRGSDIYGCDLHNEIFNTDYFIIGYYQAEQWLIANGGIFNAIDEIKEYEESNFGEVMTDFSSSEKVCNMYVYILGEQILNNCETLRECWDDYLTDENIDQLINELN